MQRQTWQPGTFFEYDFYARPAAGTQENTWSYYHYGKPEQYRAEGFYGKGELPEEHVPLAKRKGKVDWGRDVDWKGRPLGFPEQRGQRPRGVSWMPPSRGEAPSGELIFKAGEVNLNDPLWKEKLEEPTNSWKCYGKRGIELPYYEGWWRPRADIFEEEGDNLRVEFELPGIPVENLSVSVSEDMIIVTAVKPQAAKEERGFYYQNERHFGNFYRKLELPCKVDTTKVHAVFDNGVLKITLPKTEAKSKIKVIYAKELSAEQQQHPMKGPETTQLQQQPSSTQAQQR